MYESIFGKFDYLIWLCEHITVETLGIFNFDVALKGKRKFKMAYWPNGKGISMVKFVAICETNQEKRTNILSKNFSYMQN